MRKKKYDITQCALYKCRGLNTLSKELGMSKKEIDDISGLIKYKTFDKNKKDSRERRHIYAPYERLKGIQRRMLRLLQCVERPNWLVSGEKGKSFIDNGLMHLDSNYYLVVDIKGYFYNCSRENVFRFFKDRLKMAGDVAGFCTDLMTYGGIIPPGSPTSQLISFYAYEEMFEKISEIAKKYGCIFSLYVDDMTFSSERPFDSKKMFREIDCTLRRYGHKPKYKKVKYYSSDSPVVITGVCISKNHELKVPNSLQKKIYEDFEILMSTNAQVEDKEVMINSLKGRIQVARDIEGEKFSEIKRLVGSI